MKTQIRQIKLLQRLNQHPLEKKRKDSEIEKRLAGTAAIRKARAILFYLPIHGEVDLQKLFESQRLNKKFILPKVVRGTTRLLLYYVSDLIDVEKGTYNIPEPKKHLKKALLKNIDLALVPGIVFSRNGHRIGYGKGFYDRLFKRLKCTKIGVAYDFQIVDNIAGEKHDTPMDIIVTEKKTFKISHP